MRSITKGQCPFVDACAFNHEPNKKGNCKGRLRSPPPTGSLHRTSKCHGKGSGDGNAERHQNLLLTVRQGKQTHHFVNKSRKEVARRQIHVIISMFPNVQNSNLQVDANSKTSVHTNTQLILLRNGKQHLLQFAFHRMMNTGCSDKNQSDDKTQFRGRLRHLANKYVLKKGSHPDRIRKTAKSKRSNIRGKTCRMVTRACTQFHVRILRIKHMFFKPSREFIVDLRSSPHVMSKIHVAPEEQESIQKSKDPFVIMTANGTLLIRQKKQQKRHCTRRIVIVRAICEKSHFQKNLRVANRRMT